MREADHRQRQREDEAGVADAIRAGGELRNPAEMAPGFRRTENPRTAEDTAISPNPSQVASIVGTATTAGSFSSTTQSSRNIASTHDESRTVRATSRPIPVASSMAAHR